MYIRYIHWVTKTTCTPMYILSPNVYRRSPKNVTQCIYPMYIDVYIHWVLYIGLHLYTLGIYISMHIYTLGNIFSYIHCVYTLECIIYIGVFFLLWGFVDAWQLWHILMTYHDDIYQWHINDSYDISWWHILMTYSVRCLMIYHDDIYP